jgi:hypothetical protein
MATLHHAILLEEVTVSILVSITRYLVAVVDAKFMVFPASLISSVGAGAGSSFEQPGKVDRIINANKIALNLQEYFIKFLNSNKKSRENESPCSLKISFKNYNSLP